MLEVTNLCKSFGTGARFGRVRAVDDVSFRVEEGQFFTLLGPSGCGKTSTLRCIAGLERPEDGEITVDDVALFSSSRRVFVPPNERRLGMVFQSYAIWPHMNVFENVAYPFRAGRRKIGKKEIRERVERALEVVALGHLAQRYATQLSGGQQQRLALARALVIEPRVLLLDEPLSNLDAKLRESLRFELKRLQREQGITTVYVTHDQSEALGLSNVIAVMQDGRVSQLGSPLDIYLEPSNTFVADFVGSTNFIEGTLVGHADDGHHWRVTTSEGDLLVGKAVGVQAGEPCVVSIRPEQIEMREDSAGEGLANVWAGTVDTRLFVGEVMDYQVALSSQQLRCRGAVVNRLATGKPVSLHLAPEHCVALPRPTPTA